MKDYYAILGLDASACSEEINEAYMRLMSPYLFSGPGSEWERSMRENLREAYDVLSDPLRRREYDCLYAAAFPNRIVSHPWRSGWNHFRARYFSVRDCKLYLLMLGAFALLGVYNYYADHTRYWIDANGTTHRRGCSMFHDGRGHYAKFPTKKLCFGAHCWKDTPEHEWAKRKAEMNVQLEIHAQQLKKEEQESRERLHIMMP